MELAVKPNEEDFVVQVHSVLFNLVRRQHVFGLTKVCVVPASILKDVFVDGRGETLSRGGIGRCVVRGVLVGQLSTKSARVDDATQVANILPRRSRWEN